MLEVLDNVTCGGIITIDSMIPGVLSTVVTIIKIGVPILLIVFGMLDLGKAVIASKEDEIKSAQKMLIKRAIYAVAIFFVVLIVNLVFSLLGSAGTDSQGNNLGEQGMSWTTCWKQA